MKFNKYIYSLLIASISITGCTKDFEAVNTSPTSVNDLSSDLLTFVPDSVYFSDAEMKQMPM